MLLPYDKLGLAAPMRERGSVQVEEYREDGLYLEGIVKTEDLHCFCLLYTSMRGRCRAPTGRHSPASAWCG